MTVALRLIRETHRIELVRFGPEFRHMMGEQRIDADERAGGQSYPLNEKSRTARRGIDGTGGFSRSASLNAISDSGISSSLSSVGIVGPEAEAFDLLAQLLLPFRVGGELTDKGGQRRRQRVMRGHHQKTHMVDDVLGREQRAVFMGRLAQLREQVIAAALRGRIGICSAK